MSGDHEGRLIRELLRLTLPLESARIKSLGMPVGKPCLKFLETFPLYEDHFSSYSSLVEDSEEETLLVCVLLALGEEAETKEPTRPFVVERLPKRFCA